MLVEEMWTLFEGLFVWDKTDSETVRSKFLVT